VISACFSHIIIPNKSREGLLQFEEVNAVLDSSRSFMGSKRNITWFPEHHSLEILQEIFQIWDV